MKHLTIKVSTSNLTACEALFLDEQLSGLVSPKVEIDFSNVKQISTVGVGAILHASTKRAIKLTNVLPEVKYVFATLLGNNHRVQW